MNFELPITERADSGFGSTDEPHQTTSITHDTHHSSKTRPHLIPLNDSTSTIHTTNASIIGCYDPMDIELCTTVHNIATEQSGSVNACDIEMD